MTTQDDINAFTSACGAACFLKLAAQTNSETPNRMVKVATVNDLPDLSLGTVLPGTVLFVESLNIPVLAQVGCWTGLDNRELRNDCLVKPVWAWGINGAGSLGDNSSSASTLSPVIVAGGISDWCQVSASDFTNVAVRMNGTAWSWGYNRCGQLGDGTTTTRSSPVIVTGGISDWCKIGTGLRHAVAVRSSGSAWAWGCNSSGQLGTNNINNSSSPVSVLGGFTDWCQISAGFGHSVAVRTGGSAWAWGCNITGQLGDGTITNRSSPVSVVGGFSDWCQISAGYSHSVAVRSSGTLWSWGANNNGQLGDLTGTSRSSPVSVVGGFSDWCQVSSGGLSCSTLALRTNSTAWAWGCNSRGQLGDGTITNRSSPVSVVGGFTDWCQISAGYSHSVAVRTGGSAWAWGCNITGQLGDGTITNRSSPVSVVGGFSDWFQVSAGTRHSTAIRQF